MSQGQAEACDAVGAALAGAVFVVEVEFGLPDGTVRVARVRAVGLSKEAAALALWEATTIASCGRIAFEDQMRPIAH
ncbi:hypothetical protein APZ41_013025 [Roseomonas mucosa]|uniref:Uncharacterized protein n=1 Tax=Roseomonas mucosa TaxID=207340 RepID=A0A1S8D346_9PROT|nr:hypothetical protein [Roseomonas mucosa]ONH82736.1 hypothetical protein APZ41_013025 [Roseomonas mucosa]